MKRPFHRVLADRWPIAPGFLAHPTGTILFPKTKNIAGANVEAPPRLSAPEVAILPLPALPPVLDGLGMDLRG